MDPKELARRRAELHAYIVGVEPQLHRPAQGRLRHPYLDPGAGYGGQLWDWDAYYSGLALAALSSEETSPVASTVRGCVSNFVDHIRPDGSIPYHIPADPRRRNPLSPSSQPVDGRAAASAFNSAKPVLAQMALSGAPAAESVDWLRSVAPALVAHVRHWEQTQRSEHGLFTWRSHRGSGPDNHPSVYGRPHSSVAGTDLNSLMVGEYRALAVIMRRLNAPTEAARFTEAADAQAERIRTLLWDPVDRFFYHADVLAETPDNVTQKVTWVTPLKYRTWTGFWPLYAQVASPAQAEDFVGAVVADGGILAACGIRTLTRHDPLYSLAPSSKPSNWRGPVWLIANYVAFRGLLRYGFEQLAHEIADASLRLVTDDLRSTGVMHECYDPDTGRGLTHPGFLNWNLLAAIMHDQLDEPRSVVCSTDESPEGQPQGRNTIP